MDIINRLLNRPSSSASRSQSRPSTPESGNDSPLPKTSEHEVKVRFAREFADVGSVTYSGPESLSSASSFHSLSSTLSTKSSSGICPDDNLPSVTVSQENADYSSVPTVSNLSSSAGSEVGEIIFSDSNAVPQTDDIGLNPSPRSLSPIVTGDLQHLSLFNDKEFDDFVLAESSTRLPDGKTVKAQEPLPPDVLNLTDELLESLTNRLGGIQLKSDSPGVQQLSAEDRAKAEDFVPAQERAHVEHSYVRDYAPSVDSLFPTREHSSVIHSLFSTREYSPPVNTIPSVQESLFAVESPLPANESPVNVISVVPKHCPEQEPFPALELSFVREHSVVQEHPSVPESLHLEEQSSVQEQPSVPEPLPVKEHSPIQEYPPVEHISVQRHSPVKEHHTVEHILVEKNSPVREHTPVEHYLAGIHSSIREITPIEHNPAGIHFDIREHTPLEKPLIQEHTPLEKPSLIQEHTPLEKPSLIQEYTPVDKPSLIQEHTPVDKPSLIQEHTPVDKPSLIQAHTPLEKPSLIQEHTPVDKPSLIQEHSPREENPVQQFSFGPEKQSDQTHPPFEKHSRIADTSKVAQNLDTPTEKHGPRFETVDVDISFAGTNGTRSFTDKLLEPRIEQVDDLQVLFDNHKTDLLEEIESVDIVNEDKEPQITFSLDETITLDDANINLASDEKDQNEQFEPLQQENNIALAAAASNDQQSFEKFQLAAEGIANDIFKSSLELTEEATRFPDIPAEPAISDSDINELFQDPESFDFLLARGNSRNTDRLRVESLYVKFDPLVSNTSMLPQGNSQAINEEQNGKIEPPLVNTETPKRNAAIAAIDRLLFYSPIPSGTECKAEKIQEKKEQPVQEAKPDIAPGIDINVSKELELVRVTVLQLEEELRKQKKEYEEELTRQKSGYQEKVNKLQAQLAQEVKNKNQMTVVVEEYEKSISRLVAEGERDRTSLEHEKTKLQEELQTANHHLSNTEAAFNDVHQKYERIKGVVWAYKTNETVLKESIQENLETIKDLETRYDQLKNHAMHQLEKANSDLDVIRKQHDTERLKLHAMVRKAELKSNTVSGLVEQVTKENAELMQILDEVIARVGRTTVD